MRPRTERVLVVHLTTACNLRCAYCFQRDKRPRALAWGPLRHGLEWLLASDTTKARVAFTGGEPLLCRPLLTRAVEFIDRERPRALKVRIEILTNGLLLDDETIAFLERHDIHASVSLDGGPAAQDLRGRGTFARLDRLLARLACERPFFVEHRLRVAMTVCRQNVPMLADSVGYLLDAGVATVSMTPAMTADTGWTDEDTAELERQFERVYEASLDHYGRTRRVPLDLFRRTAPDAAHARPSDVTCTIGDGHALAVDATGRAVPCPLFSEGYHAPGNVLLDAAAGLIAAVGPVSGPDMAARLIACGEGLRGLPLFGPRGRKHSSWGSCERCEYLGRCSVCPVSIGLMPGNTDPGRVPDFQCAFVRASLARRDRFPVQPPLEAVHRSLDRFWQVVRDESLHGRGEPAGSPRPPD
jgi:sulfatase maturation enzyme AslB (radical SAM superfamily)